MGGVGGGGDRMRCKYLSHTGPIYCVRNGEEYMTTYILD